MQVEGFFHLSDTTKYIRMYLFYLAYVQANLIALITLSIEYRKTSFPLVNTIDLRYQEIELRERQNEQLNGLTSVCTSMNECACVERESASERQSVRQ